MIIIWIVWINTRNWRLLTWWFQSNLARFLLAWSYNVFGRLCRELKREQRIKEEVKSEYSPPPASSHTKREHSPDDDIKPPPRLKREERSPEERRGRSRRDDRLVDAIFVSNKHELSSVSMIDHFVHLMFIWVKGIGKGLIHIHIALLI